MVGPNETTMTVAQEEKGGGTLRRILLVLAVAALMAVMILAMSATAFARAELHGSSVGPAPESDGVNSGHCISDAAQGPGTNNSSAAHTANPNLSTSDPSARLCQ